jgi:hypothetical protein
VTAVTEGFLDGALLFFYSRSLSGQMEKPSTAQAVYKLAVAGEQAGFSLEEMIQLLNAGVSVETLLHLIELRLSEAAPSSSNWIM